MNLTLVANCAGATMISAALVLSCRGFPEQVLPVGLGYAAGILTAYTSQWSVRVEKKRPGPTHA